MKKKAIKIAASTAVAASAFVAAAPANKADAAVKLDQLVTDAQNAGTVLKWAISVEGSANFKTQPFAEYNAAKKAIAAAEKALKGASASDKLKYEARLTDAKIQVTRAGHYIDAITSSKKIVDLTNNLDAAIKSNDLEKVEAAYHKATAEYRKQAALLDRVYGQTTRDGIRNQVKPDLEALVASVKYEVTVHMLAKAAAADVKADKLEDAAKKLTEAQEYLDKNVKKWKTELQKSVTDVENSIPLKALSVKSESKDTVTVKFSTKIQAGAGVIPAGQFTFNNGLIVQSATVAKDGKTVTLKTTDQKAGTTYALSYQGVSTGLSFTTPASAVDNTLAVVETEVANLDNGGERAYTVNVTKADGTPYTGQVELRLLDGDEKLLMTETKAKIRTINGVIPQYKTVLNDAYYVAYAVNGKVTFVVQDGADTATTTVIPKITRVEDKVSKLAPSVTFWELATAGLAANTPVSKVAVDEKNGYLYLNTKKYLFDSNDKFYLKNVEVTQEAFLKALSYQDLAQINYSTSNGKYNKNGVSEFIINVDVTADAALKVTNPRGALTVDTNATRLEGTGQPGHIIEVYRGTNVNAANYAVATTTVDANGNWVVNSLNLDAGVENKFTVVSRNIGSTSTAVNTTVTIYQGDYATTGLQAIDSNPNGKLDIGDQFEFTFKHDVYTDAKVRNELKVSDNATITLQDSLGAMRTYTVGKVDKETHKLVIKGIERKDVNDGYNFGFGNTVIATTGIFNQDNLEFKATKSTDRVVDMKTGSTLPPVSNEQVLINNVKLAQGTAPGQVTFGNATTNMEYSINGAAHAPVFSSGNLVSVPANIGDKINVRIVVQPTTTTPGYTVDRTITVTAADIALDVAPTASVAASATNVGKTTLTVDDTMEYRVVNATTDTTAWIPVTTGTTSIELDVNLGETIQVRTKATTQKPASKSLDVTVTATHIKAAAAPTTLVVVNDLDGDGKGKITGLDATKLYEYSINGTDWFAVKANSTEIELAKNTYQVRYQATAGKPASEAATGLTIN